MLDFRLVKAGYGNLKQVRKMNSREYLQALGYEKFLSDYSGAVRALNLPGGRR